MSARAQSAADARAIIEADGDPVVLTSPVIPGTPELPGPPIVPAVPDIPGTAYSLMGIYNRIGISTDAEGMPVVGDKSTLSISLLAIMSLGLVNVEDLRKPGWSVSVADALGVTVTLRIDEPLLDRSLAVGTFILKVGAP